MPFFVCNCRLKTILQTEYVATLGVLKVALCEDYTYVPVKHYFIYNKHKALTILLNVF